MNTNDFMKQYRCIIPASYYFEWKYYTYDKDNVGTGDKYAIQPCGSEVTYLAGLCRIEEMRDLKYPVFVVLTTAPTDEFRQIHYRMPLIRRKALLMSGSAQTENRTRWSIRL